MGVSILRNREGCGSRCDDKKGDDCVSHDLFPQVQQYAALTT
jgi:hypothetical protein